MRRAELAQSFDRPGAPAHRSTALWLELRARSSWGFASSTSFTIRRRNSGRYATLV